MNDVESITRDDILKYSGNFRGKKYSQTLMNAVSKTDINAVAFNHSAISRMQHTFSDELATGKITNQKQSGRCWLFAGLNTLRERVAKKCNMENFELSQNYQAFWDKFEKANYFLESILETIEEETESRIVTWLLQNVIGDGGQWEMFCNIVEKYGVIPKEAMPETFHSSQTGPMNSLLIVKLREYASFMRKMYREGRSLQDIRSRKDSMLSEIYGILCIFLSEPPARFDFEYRDRDKNFNCERNLTPTGFYKKYVDMDIWEYVSIINAPTKDKPYNRTFTVKFLGNVRGDRDVLYLNTGIEALKELAIRQLKDGEPVWFGCDVGKMMDRTLGILDLELYRYDLALDTTFGMTKEERLDYRESCMTHAMVFTGVNIADGKPNRWKVENSWGEDKGKEGYFVMSDTWFDQYMYQVVINKKYLPDELMKCLEQKPIELQPWDPMGSLAHCREE